MIVQIDQSHHGEFENVPAAESAERVLSVNVLSESVTAIVFVIAVNESFESVSVSVVAFIARLLTRVAFIARLPTARRTRRRRRPRGTR